MARPTKQSKKQTILIVDDDPSVLESLEAFLANQLPGLQVKVAETVDAARKILSKQPVDLVLCDYLIDKTDGVEFLSEVARTHAHARRILMTGHPAQGLAVKAQQDAQVSAFAVKPLDPAQTLYLVNAVLSNPEGEFRYTVPG